MSCAHVQSLLSGFPVTKLEFAGPLAACLLNHSLLCRQSSNLWPFSMTKKPKTIIVKSLCSVLEPDFLSLSYEYWVVFFFFFLKRKSIITAVGYISTTSGMHAVPLI